MSADSQTVADRLATGPARGLGCANAIAAEALRSESILSGLLAALRHKEKLVTTRAANALKKVQAARPELLVSHARELLRVSSECEDPQTRWNLTMVLGGLPLRGRNRALAVELFFEALRSESGLQRAFALTGLANFAQQDAGLRQRLRPILENALGDSSAAVRARARKLQKGLAVERQRR